MYKCVHIIAFLLKQQVKSTGEFTELGIVRHKAMQVCILIYIFILYEKHITFNIFCFQKSINREYRLSYMTHQ
jgi:hypothetical protein